MIKSICFAGLMLTLLGAALLPARAQPASTDVLAFCKAQGDADFPGPAFFGSAYTPGAIPKQIARLDDALHWRCRDGQVLVCSDSADGDWCGRKDASRAPSKLLAQACGEEPDKASFDFAETHYSAFDWRCKKGMAVIAQSYPLDRRGFFQASWTPVLIRHGVITGPTDFPAGPR